MLVRRKRTGVVRAAMLTARVSPELHHTATVLAQLHRTTVSALIEIALTDLAKRPIEEGGAGVWRETRHEYSTDNPVGTLELHSLADLTWDEDEFERSRKTWEHCRSLLSTADQLFWERIVRDDSYRLPPHGPDVVKGALDLERVRTAWLADRERRVSGAAPQLGG